MVAVPIPGGAAPGPIAWPRGDEDGHLAIESFGSSYDRRCSFPPMA